MSTPQSTTNKWTKNLQRWLITSFVSIAAFVYLFAFSASSANATTVIMLSEEQMVEMSTLVVRGKVVSQKSVWGPQRMGIVTLVTIQVYEEILGRPHPKTVVVRHFGGQIGDQKVQMFGGVSFDTGNEVLVFLEKSKYLPPNEYLLIGLTQGKWIIHRPDTQTQKEKQQSLPPTLKRDLHGIKLVRLNKPGGTITPNTLSLHTYVQRLRSHWAKIQTRRQNNVIRLPKALPPRVDIKNKPQLNNAVKVPSVKLKPKTTRK